MTDAVADLDYWWPKLGQCLLCGVPGVDQRHRIIDAIASQVAAGEDEHVMADLYDVPVEAVRAAVAAPEEER